jgi:hypothetical protein
MRIGPRIGGSVGLEAGSTPTGAVASVHAIISEGGQLTGNNPLNFPLALAVTESGNDRHGAV